MLHYLHIAYKMIMEALRGTVEVDKAYLGGKEMNKHENKKVHGEHFAEKQIVLGVRERGGRTRVVPIENADKPTPHRLVRRHIRPNPTVCTDDSPSYHGVYHRHKTVNHSAKEYANRMAHTNGIESVWAVLISALCKLCEVFLIIPPRRLFV